MGESRELWDKITWALLDRSRTFHSGPFVHASDRLDFICAIRKTFPLDGQSLMPLLRGVRASQSTDPQDRIFAMLRLLRQDTQLCTVDYRKSVSQVFLEAAAGIWRLTGSLHFLSWSQNTVTRNGPKQPEGLPSWVPSWSISGKRLLELHSPSRTLFTRDSMENIFAQIDEHEYNVRVLPKFKDLVLEGGLLRSTVNDLLNEADISTQSKGALYRDEAHSKRDVTSRAIFLNTRAIGPGWETLLTDPVARSGKKSLYATTGRSFPGAVMNIQEGALYVLGFPLAVIQDVSPPCTEDFPLDGPPYVWVRTILNRRFGLPEYKRNPTGSNNAGSDSDSDPEDTSTLALLWQPDFWRLILADQWQGARLPRPDANGKLDIPGIGTVPPSSPEALAKIESEVRSFAHDAAWRFRKIFTSPSSIGLVPLQAYPGDVVFAIFGCDVPYLIRKTAEGSYLLGECYIHGSMDGQALTRSYISPQLVKLI